MEWNETLSLGFKKIDDDHKELFRMIKELVDAINQRTCKYKIDDVIKFLAARYNIQLCKSSCSAFELNRKGGPNCIGAYVRTKSERLSEYSLISSTNSPRAIMMQYLGDPYRVLQEAHLIKWQA